MTKGKVKGIISNLVIVEVDAPVAQNEIAYIDLDGVKLMAEVIKVDGKNVYIQVFESTRGLKVGMEVDFQGHMLEAMLGPDYWRKVGRTFARPRQNGRCFPKTWTIHAFTRRKRLWKFKHSQSWR